MELWLPDRYFHGTLEKQLDGIGVLGHVYNLSISVHTPVTI